jgi:3-hydroxyacyl-[acyl-carrier-protein] dehydratase
MAEESVLGIEVIAARLPHRHPFLLVDRIRSITPGESIVGIKNVTVNEPFFPGHFPGYPVMPGVLIIEAMAQTGGVLAWETSTEQERDSVLYLVGVDDAKFKQPVRPGDQLVMKVDFVAARRNLLRYRGVAEVDGKMVAQADIRMAFGPKP